MSKNKLHQDTSILNLSWSALGSGILLSAMISFSTSVVASTQDLTLQQTEEHAEGVSLTAKQLVEQGIQLSAVDQGPVVKLSSYPAKLNVNTDQQAHVSPSFSGHVENVYVELGQKVQKGQPLAALLVPDLVDQQANLKIEQTNLELAKQDYDRERQLWSQGISAKQDYQRAYNSYKRAQIQVQAAQSRLSAFGAVNASNGRYILKAPISGVISKKDLVLGENVQLADQLFTIDRLDQLWLEFIVPNSEIMGLAPNQKIEFKSLQTEKVYQAVIQTLNTEADIAKDQQKALSFENIS